MASSAIEEPNPHVKDDVTGVMEEKATELLTLGNIDESGSGIPWIEKYRPLYIKDCVGNAEAMARMSVIVRDGNMPNLLLTGPPGTGKTTTVLCLARQLLGDKMSSAVLELNASDDRGIEVVRKKLKTFAQKKVTLPPGRHKIVILDEADSMTEHAQQALRRIMELYSATTRFALACNFSSKVIEPIQSRCAVVRFSTIADSEMLPRLLEIAASEKASYTDDGMEALLFVAGGDMRNALNAMQATHVGIGVINAENVFKVCDVPVPTEMEAVLVSALNGDIARATDSIAAQFSLGFTAGDIMAAFFKCCQSAGHLVHDAVLLEVVRIVATCMLRSQDCSTTLQVYGMVAKVADLGGKVRRANVPLLRN